MQGADLYAVGQFLGHKTARMTQRYAHLSPQYMAATAGKLDAAFSTLALPSPSSCSESGDAMGTKGQANRSKAVQAKTNQERL